MRRRLLNAMLAEQEKRSRSPELAARLGLPNEAGSFEGVPVSARPETDASPSPAKRGWPKGKKRGSRGA